MTICSFAKVNLGLEIGRKRIDGFHDLDMVIQSVSLFDCISISKLIGVGVDVTCNKNVCEKESNLAYKAAKMLFDLVNPDFGVKIDIIKNIPVGAGLGGGSSNAAAVICGLNGIFKMHLSIEEIVNVALKIGSDVPLCFFGGTLQCRGRGEILTKLDGFPDCKILVKNGKNKNITSRSYELFDKLTVNEDSNEKNDRIRILKESLKSGDIKRISDSCFNDFEKVYKVENGWHLTGSGSSCFKIVDKDFDISDENLVVCSPVDCGLKIIDDRWD